MLDKKVYYMPDYEYNDFIEKYPEAKKWAWHQTGEDNNLYFQIDISKITEEHKRLLGDKAETCLNELFTKETYDSTLFDDDNNNLDNFGSDAFESKTEQNNAEDNNEIALNKPDAKDNTFEEIVSEYKQSPSYSKYIKKIIGFIIIALIFLLLISCIIFAIKKITQNKNKIKKIYTTIYVLDIVSDLNFDKNNFRFVQAAITGNFGGDQEQRNIIYPKTGYSGWFNTADQIKIDSAGYKWAEEADYTACKELVLDFLTNNSINSFVIKTKRNYFFESNDDKKILICLFKGSWKKVRLILTKEIDCDVIIRNKMLEYAYPFKFNSRKTAYEFNLQRDQEYTVNIRPRSDKYLTYQYDYTYEGKSTEHFIIYKNYLDLFNKINSYNKDRIFSDIKKEITKDHPDYYRVIEEIEKFSN